MPRISCKPYWNPPFKFPGHPPEMGGVVLNVGDLILLASCLCLAPHGPPSSCTVVQGASVRPASAMLAQSSLPTAVPATRQQIVPPVQRVCVCVCVFVYVAYCFVDQSGMIHFVP